MSTNSRDYQPSKARNSSNALLSMDFPQDSFDYLFQFIYILAKVCNEKDNFMRDVGTIKKSFSGNLGQFF